MTAPSVLPTDGAEAHYNPLELYLVSVSRLDIDNQFIGSDGKVYTKCFLGHIFKWLGLCRIFRGIFGESIEKAKIAFEAKVAEYHEKGQSELPRERRIQLVRDAQSRFNECVDHINSMRPENGRARLPDDFKFSLDLTNQLWTKPKNGSVGDQKDVHSTTDVGSSRSGALPGLLASTVIIPTSGQSPAPKPLISPPSLESKDGDKKAKKDK